MRKTYCDICEKEIANRYDDYPQTMKATGQAKMGGLGLSIIVLPHNRERDICHACKVKAVKQCVVEDAWMRES